MNKLLENVRRVLLITAALAAASLMEVDAAYASDHCQPLDNNEDLNCVSCDCDGGGWAYFCEGNIKGGVDGCEV